MARGTTKKAKVGRPSKYSPAVLDVVATTPLPATIAQIADHLKIDYSTVYDWMNKFEAFSEAVVRRRAMADDDIEGSLFGRARGYTTTITEEKLDKDGCTHALNKDVHVASDPNAALNWLKNRRPEKWRDVKTVEVTGDHVDLVQKALATLGLDDEPAK